MADIKTKNTKKDIKIFDKASTVGDKMKDSYIRTKNNAGGNSARIILLSVVNHL